MNAVEIIERVRARGADLFFEDGRLKVRGQGEELPKDLKRPSWSRSQLSWPRLACRQKGQ